jgi:hypothetical protein
MDGEGDLIVDADWMLNSQWSVCRPSADRALTRSSAESSTWMPCTT